MIKSKELTDPTSCLNKARPDELIFVLLARDVAASTTVRTWVAERLRLGKNRIDDPQIVEALEWATKVDYGNEHAAIMATDQHNPATCWHCRRAMNAENLA